MPIPDYIYGIYGFSDTGLACAQGWDNSTEDGWGVGFILDTSNNSIRNLGAALPYRMADNGRIAGRIKTATGYNLFLTDDSGAVQDTGIPARDVRAVNDFGKVVYSTDDYSRQNYLYDPISGTSTQIPATGIFGMNNADAVGGGNYSEIYLWNSTEGLRTFLSDSGFGGIYPCAMTDTGTISGTWRYEHPYQAFMWSEPEGFVNLGTLGDGCWVNSMNTSNTIVGWYGLLPSGSHAWIYNARTGMVDLNSLLPVDSPFQCLTSALFINANGQILGWGTKNDGNSGYFLMTPIQAIGLMKITPQTINRKGNQPFINATIELEDVNEAEIDMNEPLIIYPTGILATKQKIKAGKNTGNTITILAEFEKTAVVNQTEGGDIELRAVGKLVSGQSFFAVDTVKIIH